MALFCFLTSCSTPCQQWAFEKTLTPHPCYNSGKIYFSASTQLSGLELEIARGASGTKMYVNVFSLATPCTPHDPTQVQVTIASSDYMEILSAQRLQGGQRVLLPTQATQQIIQTLLQGESISISLGRYKGTIAPDNFNAVYAKLNQIPLSFKDPHAKRTHAPVQLPKL